MTNSIESTCIYCLEQKPIPLFNREHVMPQAFGHFKDSLVLHSEVCTDCNSYFGQTIDQILARGSLQGIARYIIGQKPLEQLGNTSRSRIDIHRDTNDPLTSDEVEFITVDGVEGFRPTAGLKYWSLEKNDWQFISLKKLEMSEKVVLEDLDRNELVIATYSDDEEKKKIVTVLRQMGLSVDFYAEKIEEFKPGQKHRIAFDVIEDDKTQRAIAKICFNYLAKMHGANFVLNEGFNPIRNFIRCGYDSATSFVHRIKKPLLHEGESEAHRRGGHLLLVDWEASGNSVIGTVSFFYMLTYQVLLGHYKSRLLIPIGKGHYFDLTQNAVIEAKATLKLSDIWIPPPIT